LTKGGLTAVTRSLAIEYAHAACGQTPSPLGVIKTRPTTRALTRPIDALHPLGRAGAIEDVVGEFSISSPPRS